ncbi:MAG: bacillithiol system redox-active protein YtxJ [Spirosomaceae bacterium]|nr:bacillithiol system redox-active protein YtxJ [Spirosomataceae bacterium]
MFFGRKKNTEPEEKISWKLIQQGADIENIKAISHNKPVVIFKHSTTCSISATALSRFERKWNAAANADIYLLDLLRHRDLSALIADTFGVQHQSPQLLVIKNGESTFNSSHFGISADEVEKIL